MEWLFDRTKETVSITAVSPLRVAAATVEPKLNQLLVRLGLTIRLSPFGAGTSSFLGGSGECKITFLLVRNSGRFQCTNQQRSGAFPITFPPDSAGDP